MVVLPKTRSTPDTEQTRDDGVERPTAPLELAWSETTVDFHRVPSGAHQRSVGQRLAEAGISLRQEPDTPAGRMVLFRAESDEQLGAFTAKEAQRQLQDGFAALDSTRRRKR